MGQTADEGNRRAEDEVRFTRTERKYRPLDGGHPDVQFVGLRQELRTRDALDGRFPRHVALAHAGDVERDADQLADARHGRLLDDPRVQAVRALLDSPEFKARIEAQGGYDTPLTGQIMVEGEKRM